MHTTLTENELDLSELDELEQEYKQQIALLQSQIQQLEEKNASLIKQIASATIEEAAVLRQQYNANKNRITELEKELSDWQKKLEDLTEARAEAESENTTQTDDYYRIPAITVSQHQGPF